MTTRATFTLEEETFSFLKSAAGDNRSAYINQLLKDEKRRVLSECLMKANMEEAENSKYQDELADWDETLSDGMN